MQQHPLRLTKDVRSLDASDVTGLRDWIVKYRHLENPEIFDSELLMDVLVRSTREYEGDFGVFALAEELG